MYPYQSAENVLMSFNFYNSEDIFLLEPSFCKIIILYFITVFVFRICQYSIIILECETQMFTTYNLLQKSVYYERDENYSRIFNRAQILQ